ncbi:metal ABC transporter ATP-binding protein [Pararhizobium mangrovi]|nr:ATP-binding cassette domain-containing protein [Pararhizobium mangrovi]
MPAFRDVTFTVPPASLTVLVGPNGAGKTTLFEALLGLLRPQAGSVRILGRAPREARRYVGLVPQSARLAHEHQLAGREFVAAAFRARRLGLPLARRETALAVGEALAAVEAQDLADRRLGTLSGGQRRRLLFAQALVNRPEILLMDEPLAELDPAAQRTVVGLAARLRDRFGLTIVFSTHDVNPLIGIAERVLYLAGGRGVIGPIEEVVTGEVLTKLYGVPMEVFEARGRRFVVQDDAVMAAAPEEVAAAR